MSYQRAGRLFGQESGEVACRCLQGGAVTRRDDQRQRPAVKLFAGTARQAEAFEDDVRVGAAETERVDADDQLAGLSSACGCW
jgi:hypothetical protein